MYAHFPLPGEHSSQWSSCVWSIIILKHRVNETYDTLHDYKPVPCTKYCVLFSCRQLLVRHADVTIKNNEDELALDCSRPKSDVYLAIQANIRMKMAIKRRNIRSEVILSRYRNDNNIKLYIALNTSRTSLSALQIYYYRGHWIQCLPAHTVCTISTPVRRYLTLKNCFLPTMTVTSYRVPILTPGSTVTSVGCRSHLQSSALNHLTTTLPALQTVGGTVWKVWK